MTIQRDLLFPVSCDRDADGQLTIAKLSLHQLSETYGTPLYLLDEATINNQIWSLRDQMNADYPADFGICYAAKAYFSLPFAKKLLHSGIGLDVASLGELSMAQKAGFAPDRIHIHGNNKSIEEIDLAISSGLHAIVIDNFEELRCVEERAGLLNKRIRIWLRITPGIEVDTHPYRQTGQAASKFGFPIQNNQAAMAIQQAKNAPHLQLTGLHFHLGSQLFDAEPYRRAIACLFDLAFENDFIPDEISPGGGWGVPYYEEDQTGDPQPWVQAISGEIKAQCQKHGWSLPKIILEPGRWLVARAGVAIYTIGMCKTAGDGTSILAVDGGMADNIRPALYQARYTACLVERPDESPKQIYRVVGKFCESGDELIREVNLPVVKRGEHLAMPVAGAYQLSMSSNYNQAARPTVLWVENGRVEVLQKAVQAFEDSWWVGG